MLNVLIRNLVHGKSSVDCVVLNPTMLRVERTLVVVRVDSRELDLVARFAHVAEVAEEDGVLRAGQAASSNLNASEVDEMTMMMMELRQWLPCRATPAA